jgi:hypothetical protein
MRLNADQAVDSIIAKLRLVSLVKQRLEQIRLEEMLIWRLWPFGAEQVTKQAFEINRLFRKKYFA